MIDEKTRLDKINKKINKLSTRILKVSTLSDYHMKLILYLHSGIISLQDENLKLLATIFMMVHITADSECDNEYSKLSRERDDLIRSLTI